MLGAAERGNVPTRARSAKTGLRFSTTPTFALEGAAAGGRVPFWAGT